MFILRFKNNIIRNNPLSPGGSCLYVKYNVYMWMDTSHFIKKNVIFSNGNISLINLNCLDSYSYIPHLLVHVSLCHNLILCLSLLKQINEKSGHLLFSWISPISNCKARVRTCSIRSLRISSITISRGIGRRSLTPFYLFCLVKRKKERS